MQKTVIIVGAGVIGAAVAYRVSQSGARVIVLDAEQAGATPASFGWINASYFLNEDHFRLRAEAMAAWHELQETLELPISWCGSLCWEEGRFEMRQEDLKRLGYDVELVTAARFAEMEPNVGCPPEQSLYLPSEGAVEPDAVTRCLLSAAQDGDVQVMRGVHVTEFLQDAGRVTGVCTEVGDLNADMVLIAAGIGSKPLATRLGFDLPMLHRPALVIKTTPVPRILDHILVSDAGEVRQLPCGALVMPAVPGHQGDDRDAVTDVHRAADAALARLQALVPGTRLDLAETILAERPMPGDGLPVVGPLAEGAYLATMHSGITLAALMGELIREELLHGETNHSRAWLAQYRPERFI